MKRVYVASHQVDIPDDFEVINYLGIDGKRSILVHEEEIFALEECTDGKPMMQSDCNGLAIHFFGEGLEGTALREKLETRGYGRCVIDYIVRSVAIWKDVGGMWLGPDQAVLFGRGTVNAEADPVLRPKWLKCLENGENPYYSAEE